MVNSRGGIKEAHQKLDKWYDDGCIGYLIFFHPPGKLPGESSRIVDCFAEQVIKMRELPEGLREIISEVFKRLEFDKAELHCDDSGHPDRIKITRSVK